MGSSPTQTLLSVTLGTLAFVRLRMIKLSLPSKDFGRLKPWGVEEQDDKLSEESFLRNLEFKTNAIQLVYPGYEIAMIFIIIINHV